MRNAVSPEISPLAPMWSADRPKIQSNSPPSTMIQDHFPRLGPRAGQQDQEHDQRDRIADQVLEVGVEEWHRWDADQADRSASDDSVASERGTDSSRSKQPRWPRRREHAANLLSDRCDDSAARAPTRRTAGMGVELRADRRLDASHLAGAFAGQRSLRMTPASSGRPPRRASSPSAPSRGPGTAAESDHRWPGFLSRSGRQTVSVGFVTMPMSWPESDERRVCRSDSISSPV